MEEVVETGVGEAVVDPAILPELRYSFQPTDDEGRPLGAKQVIKYKTPEELADKLAEQNTLLIRKLRSETRKMRLGITESDEIPAESQRFAEPLSFKPIELTADQKIQISRDLLDPEKFEEASNAMVTAKFGVEPEKITQTLSEIQNTNIRILAKIESDAFVASTPDYVKCQSNFEAITSWMVRYGLSPVRENFKLAYDKLKKAGVLIVNYEDVPEEERVEVQANSVVSVQAAPAVENVAPVATVDVKPVTPVSAVGTVKPDLTPGAAQLPTGFTRNNSDSVGPVRNSGDDVVYRVKVNRGTNKEPIEEVREFTGLAAINAMPADVYRKWILSNPQNAAVEKQLIEEAASKRRAKAIAEAQQ